VTRTPTPNPNRVVQVGAGPNGMAFFDPLHPPSQPTWVSTILVGTTVEWQWVVGTGPHSTTSGSCLQGCIPDFVWDSNQHSGPFSYLHTFNTPGTYNYFCSVHQELMQGVINVVAP